MSTVAEWRRMKVGLARVRCSLSVQSCSPVVPKLDTNLELMPRAFRSGATRMPAVRAAAEQLVGGPPCASIDPKLCVALGAAVHAGVLSGDIRDGLELMDGRYSAGWHDRAFGFA